MTSLVKGIFKNNHPLPKDQLLQGEDYYIENGFWVFTEKYLKERGFCCGSKCRHCPYEHINVVKNDKTKQ